MSWLADALRLVVHDARLAARGFWGLLGRRSTRFKVAVVVAAVLALHALAFAAASYMPDDPASRAVAVRIGGAFLTCWCVAGALTSTTRWLYQRGDLDLLLASPLDPRALLAARLLTTALGSVGSIGLLALPFANVSALLGRPQWLALYPALASVGLFGAALGFPLALALVALLGPRRARVASQIVASLVGGSAVLAPQAFAMLSNAARARALAALGANFAEGGAARWWLATPERAALGDIPALLIWFGLAAALFAGAAIFGARPFVRAALACAGAPASSVRSQRPSRFPHGLGAAMRTKEYRLLWRDPWLVSQMMLQALYTLPVGLVLWRQGGAIGQPTVAFGPMLAVMAGQFAGALAWLALSGEDAPDFLATAPATRGQIERAKLAAILAPVALVMGAPILALAWVSPWGALSAALGGCGAAVSGALLMLWRQAPARRGMILRRHSQSKWLALGEHWLSLLWAAATATLALGSSVCLVPVILAALTLWIVRPATPRPTRWTAAPASPLH